MVPKTIDEALDDALKRVQRLTAQQSEIEQQLREARLMVEGLRAAAKMYDEGEPEPNDTPLTDKTRTDAVLWVLERAEGPMSPNDIMLALHEGGRQDRYNAVSAALAHLAANDRVHNPRRGEWLIGPRPLADVGDRKDDGAVEIFPRTREAIQDAIAEAF